MSDTENHVGSFVLTPARYVELLIAEDKMFRLAAAGVDNWDWYGEALSSEYSGNGQSFSDYVDEIKEEFGVTNEKIYIP